MIFKPVRSDLPLDLWSLATEGTQESDRSEYKHLQCEKNVFMQPRAEAKRVWTMPRQGKGRMKSNEQ